MRQELSFLDHLVRLIGQEPDTGYRPGGTEATRPRLPRRGRPGLGHGMADLDLLGPPDLAARAARPPAGDRHHLPQHREREHRGLLAPGRRHDADRGARGRSAAPATVGHLGAGVTVEGFRRIRDAFLDLQYRAQSDAGRRPGDALDAARPGRARARPSRATTASPASSTSSGTAGPTSRTRPTNVAAPPGADRPGQEPRRRRSRPSTRSSRPSRRRRTPSTRRSPAPPATCSRSPTEIATLNGAIKQFASPTATRRTT